MSSTQTDSWWLVSWGEGCRICEAEVAVETLSHCWRCDAELCLLCRRERSGEVLCVRCEELSE